MITNANQALAEQLKTAINVISEQLRTGKLKPNMEIDVYAPVDAWFGMKSHVVYVRYRFEPAFQSVLPPRHAVFRVCEHGHVSQVEDIHEVCMALSRTSINLQKDILGSLH